MNKYLPAVACNVAAGVFVQNGRHGNRATRTTRGRVMLYTCTISVQVECPSRDYHDLDSLLKLRSPRQDKKLYRLCCGSLYLPLVTGS